MKSSYLILTFLVAILSFNTPLRAAQETIELKLNLPKLWIATAVLKWYIRAQIRMVPAPEQPSSQAQLK